MPSISTYDLNNQNQLLTKTIVGGRIDKYSDTELRWNAVDHDVIGLYNGESWELVAPSGIVRAYNTAVTISGAGLTYDKNYDVYAQHSGVTNNFSLMFQEWAGDNSRYTVPERFQGVLVYDADTVAGRKRRFLGTVRLVNSSGAKFYDQKDKRFVQNKYNKQMKTLGKNNPYSSNTSISSSTTAWRVWNNNASQWIVEFLCDGINQIRLSGNVYMEGSWSTIGFSLDSTNTSAPECMSPEDHQTQCTKTCIWSYIPSEGYHYSYPMSKAASGNEYYWYVSGQAFIYSVVEGSIYC